MKISDWTDLPRVHVGSILLRRDDGRRFVVKSIARDEISKRFFYDEEGSPSLWPRSRSPGMPVDPALLDKIAKGLFA